MLADVPSVPDWWRRERPLVTNQVVLFQGGDTPWLVQDRSVSGPTNPLARYTTVGAPASRTPSGLLQVNKSLLVPVALPWGHPLVERPAWLDECKLRCASANCRPVLV